VEPGCCVPYNNWPLVDNGVTCGDTCTALVQVDDSNDGKCDKYCASFGHVCVASAEEVDENCQVKYTGSCGSPIRGTSDMLCTCHRPDPAECPVPPVPAPSSVLKAMSYNTEYRGYPGRVPSYGKKIRQVNAAIVGTQENQDKYALARASGYSLVPISGNRNPIYYNPSMVTYVEGTSGTMRIPRDNYARRYISWAQFSLGNSSFWHFNTHLPHNHNEARSRNTHARIARMLLRKRAELGAGDAPTVVTGDMNPFASNGNTEGSFESVLVAAGFHLSYKARGNTGGYRGLDKILASRHWRSFNGADQGTGSSDHPAIAVDLELKTPEMTPA